jgi:hypothetical protein
MCPTNKKNGCQREKETHKTDGESKKYNKMNSSGELILSMVNKKLYTDLQMSLIVMLQLASKKNGK